MHVKGAGVILLVMLVITSLCVGCTFKNPYAATPTPTPTVSETPTPVVNINVQTPQPTPKPTPKPYFGKHPIGTVLSGNINNTDGMVILEKTLNGSYYKMAKIHMEDSTTGIYTKKYDPKWYSAQSVDRSYPAVIGHVNSRYIDRY